MSELMATVSQSSLMPWLVLIVAAGIVIREAWRVSDDVFWGDSFAEELDD